MASQPIAAILFREQFGQISQRVQKLCIPLTKHVRVALESKVMLWHKETEKLLALRWIVNVRITEHSELVELVG